MSAVDTKGAVDCDVHCYFRDGMNDLAPYLDDAWRRRLIEEAPSWLASVQANKFQFPSTYHVNLGGTLRPDATPPGGGLPNSDPAFTVTDLLDRYEFDAAVLTCGNTLGLSGVPNADLAIALATATNAWMVERWLDFDHRYKGSILVAPQDPAAAVKEIERWAAHPGMVQIFLPPMPISMGKRHFWPIYEAAQEFDLVVATHPGGESAGANGPMTAIDTPSYYMDYHTSLEQVYQRQLISLIAEGVFDRYPRLRVALIEGGFVWLPSVMWRMDADWKALRAEVPWLTRLPSEYMVEHVRVTTQPLPEPKNPDHLLQIMEMFGAQDMLMFSTDYPHWDSDSPDFSMRRLPAEMRENVMRRNPKDFYRLG